VRSVKRDELNPNDLKARLIAHFENPMPIQQDVDDVLALCESNFERDLMKRLLDRGYRVKGQVGSVGYRIDMVVEGADRSRLAVECDGDRYHGPEQWRQDMRRQRVLERVGWRFWRCFASSYYRNPDGLLNELIDMLTRMGIEPIGKNDNSQAKSRFTEHRTVHPAASERSPTDTNAAYSDTEVGEAADAAPIATGIGVGDKVVLLFADNQKRVSFRLVETGDDLEKGRVSIGAPLGRAIVGAEEGDEVELNLDDGRVRKLLIESVEKNSNTAATPIQATATTDSEMTVT
jgi:very-short-patch-repair endonuclease